MDKGQSSKKTHKIPGPGGIVQAALHKRAKGKESAEEEVLPTQEYIARAMVEPQFDDSFSKTPWECVRSFGYLDMDCYSPIHTIVAHSRRCDYQRIPLVVGIVNTYKPNGLGDAMLELKDESGSISGSITRKVLSNTNFSGKIGVGAVLVLGDIPYFKPSGTVYLNITIPNVYLVISKQGEVLQAAPHM